MTTRFTRRGEEEEEQVDSPVDPHFVATLVDRHRLCHGDYRPLVEKGAH